MVVAIWLAGPAAAMLLTILTRVRWERAYLLFVAGVVVALAFVVVVYLQAPPDYQHSQGDEDGEMFLGRWWEPQFIAFLAIIGYVLWGAGVVVGLLARGAVDLVRHGARDRP